MQTEENYPLQCVEHHSPSVNIVDDGGPLILPSSSDSVVPPKLEKRPTRKWAAWTREEEESFFTALRQVGKNFEKITCRVQSKNKDQVRHYYYRLVKRMNKLLGPGLCLDAKNSKDTNAAMLRWWSLLEKYSFKASKLHLKPRRFKIFVEALEHQLHKDRKKYVRKRSPQGENCSSTPLPNQNKSSGSDTRAAKIVVVDTQNIQKTAQGKKSLTRRNSHIGVSGSISKGESSPTKSTRQRRKNGALSAAATKRWEKAAIAGVSLVADAAEHLERAAVRNEGDPHSGLRLLSIQAVECSMDQLNCTEQTGSDPPGQVQANLQRSLVSSTVENNVQAKLKLQLFPIDESTRTTLEKDNHNPHLELTLSARKKISSILEHLNRKWGSSSVVSGDITLFPFDIQRENLLEYQRWSRDSVVSAGDVYGMVGSPSVFRLRYGWLFGAELQSATSKTPSAACGFHVPENEGQQVLMDQTPSTVLENNRLEKNDDHFNKSDKQAMTLASGEAITNTSESCILLPKENQASDGSTLSLRSAVDQSVIRAPTLTAGEWADTLTEVREDNCVGDLLTEVREDMDANCVETPFSCDSFDAAIAAHILNQNKMWISGFAQHSSSIWDAEETCDAFSFQKGALPIKQNTSSSYTTVVSASHKATIESSSACSSSKIAQDLLDEPMALDTVEEEPIEENPSEPHEAKNFVKDPSTLSDIYWPDSLGPLELEEPTCKYYSEDIFLSDSLSGLIASSLDAFQNCSFFNLDERERVSPPSAKGAQGEGASFAGKIGKSDSTDVPSLQV